METISFYPPHLRKCALLLEGIFNSLRGITKAVPYICVFIISAISWMIFISFKRDFIEITKWMKMGVKAWIGDGL